MTSSDKFREKFVAGLQQAIAAVYPAEVKASEVILAQATRAMLLSASIDVAKVPFPSASFAGGRITAVARFTMSLSPDAFWEMDQQLLCAETSAEVSKALLAAAMTIEVVSLPEGGDR